MDVKSKSVLGFGVSVTELLCKSSIWFTEKHIFKMITYFFNTSKCATNYVISFEVHDGFIGQEFEAMKAGKSAIRPWLSCQYQENTPSVSRTNNSKIHQPDGIKWSLQNL